MKKLIFCIVFVMFSASLVWSQDNSEEKKIESLKVAFITEELNLNSQEAEKFWPIYRKYEAKNDKLYDEKWCAVKNGLDLIDEIDEATASALLDEYIDLKMQSAQLKEDFVNELKGVIPSKKILHLKKAERDFHRDLLKKLKNK
ncbi:hypothetical protein ACFSQ0_06905 [Mesonia sediminis]|uniref:Sensor of ECF-type sigma factor n=1 Tax=Mesonia sediminis TaxID=1703946 RepID=A0ABW5SG80_9FLAO